MKGIIVGIAVIVGLMGLLTGAIFGGGGSSFHVAEADCGSLSVRFVGGDSGEEQQLCFSGGSTADSGPRRHLFVAGDEEWAVAIIRDYWREPTHLELDLERFLDLVLDYTPNVRRDGAYSAPFQFEAYDIMTFTANMHENGESIITGCFGFLRRPAADAAEAGSRQQVYGFYCRAGTDEISKSGIASILRRVKSRDA